MDGYLILSLKWSKSQDWLVWYKPRAMGYTADLNKTGVFTEDEARRNTSPGITIAIPRKVAMRFAETRVMVHDTRLDDLIDAAMVPCGGVR